jgi:amino acid transporter
VARAITEESTSRLGPGLHRRYLGFTEVLGQSVANDGPSLAIATGAGLVAIDAGAGTTWVFVAATVAIVLVALNLSNLAKRLASAGSLYEFARQGLGNLGGFLVGWALMLGYICGAMFSVIAVWVYLTGFLADSNVDSSAAGWGVLTVVVAGLLAGALAFRSIRLSTRLQLGLEAASILVILILAIVILVKNGATFDHAQWTAKGTDLHGMILGFPLAILSFVGFESSASLGMEAKRPFSQIPRSVLGTAIGIGVFFIFLSYVQLAGFHAHGKDIATSSAPLNDLASFYGVGTLGQAVSAGVVVSAFGIALACINAAARIALTMSSDGLLPRVFARTHPTHRTPAINIIIAAALVIIIPAALLGAHKDPIAMLTYIGEYTALGLLIAYLGVCVATPFFLARTNALGIGSIIIAILGTVAVLAMIIGQCVPIPPNPIDLLLLGFLGWLVIGAIVYTIRLVTVGDQVIPDATTTESNPLVSPNRPSHAR